jgi:hypothetical protein
MFLWFALKAKAATKTNTFTLFVFFFSMQESFHYIATTLRMSYEDDCQFYITFS